MLTRVSPLVRFGTTTLAAEAGRNAGRLFGVLTLLAVLLFSLPVMAAETINSFTTDVTLKADGSVEVTETIVVNAEGNEIRRGIFRDIFTTMVNPDNSVLRSDLKVMSVTRDGRPETYEMQGVTTAIERIRIGKANVMLDRGIHTYTIRYTMSRMGRYFEDHDELYWNATGNFWSFPILKSVTNITLPEGARISQLAGYTGTVGSTEQAVTVNRTSDRTATFTVNRTLAPGEGVTVAAAFQKGILTERTGLTGLAWWISDHRDLVFPAFAVFLVLVYNLFAWTAVGRDPAKGTIIPLFHPPKGFSPALLHYVHKMGWANSGWTAFTAAIFDLGVKGLVEIDNLEKNLKVTITGKGFHGDLPPGEKVVYDYIASKRTLVVNTSNGAKLNEKRGEFVKTIETENRQVYFRNNGAYVFGAIALSAALLGLLILLGVMEPIYLLVAFVGGIAVGVFASLFPKLWSGNLISKFIIVVWLLVGGGNFFGAAAEFLSDVRFDNGLVAAFSIVFINVVFAFLMRAPTVQGRKVMDQIDGLKMYLDTAEKNRLNFEGKAPAMTVTRFEQLLPYAIALGVEKPWSEHFEGELARHAVSDAADGSYQPSWYHSRSGWNTSSGGFANTVAAATSGMSAAMIAAQPVQSSSSGFSSGGGGGGGSSGGGGGGGGGGGW